MLLRLSQIYILKIINSFSTIPHCCTKGALVQFTDNCPIVRAGTSVDETQNLYYHGYNIKIIII
jgi:hypothetical protein